MEGLIRKAGKLVDLSPVVVLSVVVLAEAVVLGVLPGKNASATGVQPVAGVLF